MLRRVHRLTTARECCSPPDTCTAGWQNGGTAHQLPPPQQQQQLQAPQLYGGPVSQPQQQPPPQGRVPMYRASQTGSLLCCCARHWLMLDSPGLCTQRYVHRHAMSPQASLQRSCLSRRDRRRSRGRSRCCRPARNSSITSRRQRPSDRRATGRRVQDAAVAATTSSAVGADAGTITEEGRGICRAVPRPGSGAAGGGTGDAAEGSAAAAEAAGQGEPAGSPDVSEHSLDVDGVSVLGFVSWLPLLSSSYCPA